MGMIQKLPIRFALGVALVVAVFLVKPGWFSEGIFGFLLYGYTAVCSILTAFALFVAVSDLLARPERRLRETTPWIDLVASGVGLGVLLWVVYASSGPALGNVIALSSITIGLAMFWFTRWNAWQQRQSAT